MKTVGFSQPWFLPRVTSQTPAYRRLRYPAGSWGPELGGRGHAKAPYLLVTSVGPCLVPSRLQPPKMRLLRKSVLDRTVESAVNKLLLLLLLLLLSRVVA